MVQATSEDEANAVRSPDVGDAVMPLNKALWILSEAHTRDDIDVGFTVERLPHVFDCEWSREEYIQAWRSVRYNTGKQTEPQR